MTLVVSMSANTAAYAAQAVKPKAQVSGDQVTEEAITLLSGNVARKNAAPPPLAPVQPPAFMSLLMLYSNGRKPMTPYRDVLEAYEENSEEPRHEEAGARDHDEQQEAVGKMSLLPENAQHEVLALPPPVTFDPDEF